MPSVAQTANLPQPLSETVAGTMLPAPQAGGQTTLSPTMQGTHGASLGTCPALLHLGLMLATHAMTLTRARLRARAGKALGGAQLHTGRSGALAGPTELRTGTSGLQRGPSLRRLAGEAGGSRLACRLLMTATTPPQTTGTCQT